MTNLTLPPRGTRCAAEYSSQPPASARAAAEDRPMSVTGRPLH